MQRRCRVSVLRIWHLGAHMASSCRLVRSSSPCTRRQLGSVQFPVSWNFLQRRSSGPPLRRLCLTAALGAAIGILPLETARGTTAPPALASLHECVLYSMLWCAYECRPGKLSMHWPSAKGCAHGHTTWNLMLLACCEHDHLVISLDWAVSVESMLSVSSFSTLLVTKLAEMSTLTSSALS